MSTKENYSIYYIRFLLCPIGAFFSILSCAGALIAHFFYSEMRKGIYNGIAFIIIACHECVAIYVMLQSFRNFEHWNPDFEYNNNCMYYDTFKGMFAVFSLFCLCANYGSLSHCIVSLCQVYNAKLSLSYIVVPIAFGFLCMSASTFLLQDIGIKDFLVDGITDGSLSELLHIIIIFILVPYVIYSFCIVYLEHRKYEGQSDQSKVDSEFNTNKELFSRHMKYIIVFLASIIPACFVELLPMLWKTILQSSIYKIAANICAILFSCSGIGVAIVRLYDPYVKYKVQSAIAKIFKEERLEIEKYEENENQNKENQSNSSSLLSDHAAVTSEIPLVKPVFNKAQDIAVYNVN